MARRSLLAMLLPTPDEIVRSYLTTDERMILVDQPSTKAFVVEAIREIIILGLLLIVTGYVAVQGSSAVAAIGFIAIDILAIVLIIQRMQRWFTRYVLTDFRVIRSWGILNRQMAWIPWAKVTDISLTQTFLGRTLGYATVRIESANEASGFKEINDLREPHRFHRVISEMVEAKQGKTVPYWMQPPGVGLPNQVAPDNVLFD